MLSLTDGGELESYLVSRGWGENSGCKRLGVLVVSFRGNNKRFGLFQGLKYEICQILTFWYLLGVEQ